MNYYVKIALVRYPASWLEKALFICIISFWLSWGRSLGHQLDEILDSFAPCYSQSFYRRIFYTKPYVLYSGFKNTYKKKIGETRNLESIREKHLLESKNQGRNPDKNSSLIRLEFMPKNLEN